MNDHDLGRGEGESTGTAGKRAWEAPKLQVVKAREAEAAIFLYGGIDGGFYHS
jgi:hypothetical protein